MVTKSSLFPIFIPKLSTQVIQEGLTQQADQSFENLGFFPAAQSGWNKVFPGLLNSFFLFFLFHQHEFFGFAV